MKNILTVIKKEFKRFFTDRRMIITIILPGLLIYVLYSLMGTMFTKADGIEEDYKPTACIIATPENLSAPLSYMLDIKELSEDEAKKAVSVGTLDILVVFPENFTLSLGTLPAPDVKVYYNSSSQTSSYGFACINIYLNGINTSAFTVNKSETSCDLAEERDVATQMLSMVVPMLMFSLLASSCMAVAPESIAGEKERGTMATMLITPIGRGELALGKIISLTCFALLSGLSSFLGVILSFPKLMGGIISADAAALYTVGDYFLILAIIVSVVFVIISAFSVMSAFAKSVKEAGALITPLMILIILLGMASMFFSGSPQMGYYLIPLLGSGLAMSSVMSFTSSLLGIWLSVISNLVLSALLVVLLAFMFKSERIMFKK